MFCFDIRLDKVEFNLFNYPHSVDIYVRSKRSDRAFNLTSNEPFPSNIAHTHSSMEFVPYSSIKSP